MLEGAFGGIGRLNQGGSGLRGVKVGGGSIQHTLIPSPEPGSLTQAAWICASLISSTDPRSPIGQVGAQ